MYHSQRSRFSSQYKKQKLIVNGLIGITLGVIGFFILAFGVFAWFAKDLPFPGKLSQATSYSTVFYDRDDKPIYEMFKDKNRVPVSTKDVSDYLQKATIAIEDKNFYKHKGVSEIGILRGFLSFFFKGRFQGGSTITQQLIKNTLLSSQRSLSRKIKEAILAFEVERRYSKTEILGMYLSEAPYGGIYWGAASASMAYFGKSPKELSLLESAILAGIPQNPSFYSPFIGEKNAWQSRTKDVLRRMREDGYITADQEKKTVSQFAKVVFLSPKVSISGAHFVFYVKDLIEKEYDSKLIEQGIKVKTTLSLDVQKLAEKIVKEEIENLKGYNASNAAVVVLDSKTGEILAMVGSYDYNDEKFGKFNAALGLRQPGSAIKPITYALALEKGYTPSTLLMDTRTVFANQGEKDYVPVNYDGKYRGPMQLRFALGNSENVPAVKLLAMVGIRDFLQKAYDMGLDSLAATDENIKRFGLSVTLGGGETTLLDLTSSFSVFADQGLKKQTSPLMDISDFKGKNIYKTVKAGQKKVLTPEVAFLVSHILSDNNARMDIFGPNSYLNVPGKTVAVKTGTTDDKRDNWAIGFTKSITVGVWVGNNDNSAMNPKIASGATGASPIWYQLMRQLLAIKKDKQFKYSDGIMEKPDKVKAQTIDAYLGGLPKDGYPTRSEYYIEGEEPKDISPFYKKLKISKATGKLANDVEIKTGNYDEKEYIIISENDPVSTDNKNRWQEAIDQWAREQKDDKYHPPTDKSDANSDSVIVSIKSPEDKQTINSNSVTIRVKITSVYPMKSVKIFSNGSELKSYNENKTDIEETINLSDGVYEIKVQAVNEKDKSGDSSIKIGVNKPWDLTSPTPTQTPTPTPILSLP